MQVGVTLFNYSPDIARHNLTLDDAILHAASCGARTIEIVDAVNFLDWPHPKLTDIFHYKDIIESNNMKLVNISQFTENEYSADYICTEEDKLQQVKESILYAHILGVPMTRITPFMNVNPGKDNKIIEKCLPYAEKYDVILCLELQIGFKPELFLQIMKYFNSPYLKILADLSAWSYIDGAPIDTFKDCLPYICHVHGKARTFIEPGTDDPNIPFRNLINMLKVYGYNQSIAAEFVPKAGSPPELFDTRKGTELLIKYIYSLV